MLADLIKDIREDLILKAMEQFQLTRNDAEEFVDNYPNEADWPQVADVAEALGVDIMDVQDIDVEGIQSIWDMGGSKGKSYTEIKTSMGKAFIYYSLGSYYLLLIFNNGNPANYPITRSDMDELYSPGSLGNTYNEKFRDNDKYSDIPGAWGCIGPDPDKPKRLATPEDKAKLPKDLQDYI